MLSLNIHQWTEEAGRHGPPGRHGTCGSGREGGGPCSGLGSVVLSNERRKSDSENHVAEPAFGFKSQLI